jgi:hypothetical protein
MVSLIVAMLAYSRAFILPRHRLGLETAALRQQLAVFKRKQPRPKLRKVDRVFWVALRHLWSGWADALIIVKPETVASWHRAASSRTSSRRQFNERRYWRAELQVVISNEIQPIAPGDKRHGFFPDAGSSENVKLLKRPDHVWGGATER